MKRPHLKLRKSTKQTASSRITNDTVAEHRERILAGGRRYKYPLQYARHKLVFNAIVIAAVVAILFVAFCLQQLYMAQTTSTFFYRITSFVPLPVASVDGTQVRYSDYLLSYNGSAYYLEQSQQIDPATPDGKAQLQHLKRESLTNAEKYAYATKLAQQNDITISDDEINQAIDENRSSYGDVSEQAYYSSSQSIYGWSPDEVRRIIMEGLLVQKVKLSIDTEAKKTTEAVAKSLAANKKKDLSAVADAVNKTAKTKVQLGGSGDVPLMNVDGGLSQAAAKLKPGEATKAAVVSSKGTGYYFIKLNSKSDSTINYSYIQVPLTEFATQFVSLKEKGKLHEYITVKDA